MKISNEDIQTLVSEHYGNLYRFALSLAHNQAEAADLTQQTFLTLATKGGQLRDIGKAKSWLFTVLYREFLKLRKLTNRFSEIDEEAPETISSAIDEDACRKADAKIVIESLYTIPEIFRAPVSLFYLEDLSYREISEVLEIPIGTVMSRLSRGKKELRSRITSHINENSSQPDNVVRLPEASGE